MLRGSKTTVHDEGDDTSLLTRLSGWLTGALARWQPPTDVILIGTALFVGIGTGAGAVIFRYLIQAVVWIGYEWVPAITADWGKAYVLIVPTIGGLLVGPLIFYFAREAKGHGVPEVMEAVALRGGRIRPIVAVVKSLASSISIGSGGSVGREGPIVQIGSALGSTVGQLLHLSPERVRNLVACGAAAGIAATFNAPIAGVVFALEIILGEFTVRYFSTVVISAVAASVIGRIVFGDAPAFPIPVEYGLQSLWEFLFYSLMGVIAALVGVLFVRVLYWSEDRFDSWKGVPEWIKPAVGGALLGGLALAYPAVTGVTWDRVPHVFNVGYDVIEATLANQLALRTVLVLLVLKLAATSLTLGSGGSGGVFAPSLFMGAMLGAAMELLLRSFFPGLVAPAGAYALVSMAAVFAATAHAPITAILILFELTGDYRIILPLMLTVVIATMLAQRLLNGESIYTLKLMRRGVALRRGRDVDIMQGITVGEAMTTDVYVVEEDMPLDELGRYFERTHAHSFPVVDKEHRLVGIVSITDYERALAQGGVENGRVVGNVATTGQLMVAYDDEPMGDALQRLAVRAVNKLPVVTRDDPRQIVGVIRRRDIIKAYNIALARRMRHPGAPTSVHVQPTDGVEFLEVRLQPASPAAGKSISDLAGVLPRDCIVVAIRRHGNLLFPHGDTVLQAGDDVTAFLSKGDEGKLRKCLLGNVGRRTTDADE